MKIHNKFFGVVEGFYGKPYTFRQRRDLIAFLSDCRLNTYVYGPKQDRFHRQQWYAPYPAQVMRQFEKLVSTCEQYGVHFNYALSPLAQPDNRKIIKKIARMICIGIHHFSLFYDDIAVPLTREIAEKQLHSANELMAFLSAELKHPVLFFCPTQYRGFKRTTYIDTIAKKLNEKIHIFWTGKHVVAKSITAADVAKVTRILHRPPLIWDNIFANDYIPETILRFPYYHRSKKIINKVTGIFINPMNQYEPSKPLIQTAAQFFNDPQKYVPQQAWRNVH